MIGTEAMKIISVRITVPIYEEMREYCRKHKVKQSDFIRQAIAEHLKQLSQ